MAHTEPEPDQIIPQKPPPPDHEDGGRERGPRPPGTQEPTAPSGPPIEAPPQQPIAPRVASAPASRRHARKPSGHLVVPSRESDPGIISHGAARPRMASSPMMLIDYPRLHRPALTTVR